MTMEANLKSLVEVYAKFDQEKGIYINKNESLTPLNELPSLDGLVIEHNSQNGIHIGPVDGEQPTYPSLIVEQESLPSNNNLSEEQLFNLERSFNLLLNQCLLHDGAETERIAENYNKLLLLFETPADLLPEVKWLEQQLSKGVNDGLCKRTLTDCYQRLVTPSNYKELTFGEITNQDDLKKWLENLSSKARTYNERSLYNSLLGLLNESVNYYDEIGKVKPTAIKALLSFIPVLLVSIGTLAFAEELLAIYALYFIVLKGGEYIGKTNISELQSFGGTVQQVTSVTAATTTALLVRLMELIFWSSRQCYMATLQVGCTVLEPLFSGTDSDAVENIEEALLKAGENKDAGLLFRNYQLKLIVAPIEIRCSSLKEQWFLRHRTGAEKDRVLTRFLTKMRELDQNHDPIETKLEAAQRLIVKLKENKMVYEEGRYTGPAINKAERFLQFFINNPLAMMDGKATECVGSSSL
ncbi:J domain-containing protein [Legionella lytica]|uniref:J domain-containing protein n=1 Tax=Legionella lytica TaxID=96232 RepID=A0ABY4YAW6_9GAMM|nr:J domain-containing protein [Legionella lytica]USQ14771.1 J domain-containing protein [Legionella lytica]